jgi:hypothetical protein
MAGHPYVSATPDSISVGGTFGKKVNMFLEQCPFENARGMVEDLAGNRPKRDANRNQTRFPLASKLVPYSWT